MRIERERTSLCSCFAFYYPHGYLCITSVGCKISLNGPLDQAQIFSLQMNRSESAQQASTVQRKLPALLMSGPPKHLCGSRENTVLRYLQIIHRGRCKCPWAHHHLMVHFGRRRVGEVYSYSMLMYLLLTGILPLLSVII